MELNAMRILFCGINYAPDLIGVPKFNTELCEWLRSRGHDIRVVTASPYYPEWKIPENYKTWLYRTEMKGDVIVTRSPIYVPRSPSGTKRLMHHASFALTSAWPVINEARRWHPHLLVAVAPSLMSCALVALVARRLGAKSWLHLQDFEVDAAFNLGLLNHKLLHKPMLAIERRILRSFDRVSTISPQMLRNLGQKGVNAEKTYEMRNWVDTHQVIPGSRITIFRDELSLSESDLVALYSGTMSNKQGIDVIIEAAKELEQSHPHIHFILCGEGPEKSKLREISAGLCNVHFIGLQSNERFAQLLNTADIHLLPQRAEAADLVMPSKLGGILASGRPVIAMAQPGTGLANEVQSAGLLIPPGNTNALVSAIRTLAEDTELRKNLALSAREHAKQRWDKTIILRSFEHQLIALQAQTSNVTMQ